MAKLTIVVEVDLDPALEDPEDIADSIVSGECFERDDPRNQTSVVQAYWEAQ